MRRFTVLGQKVAAHDKKCADNYRQDRKLGLVYGLFENLDGSFISWAEASVRYNFCVYCVYCNSPEELMLLSENRVPCKSVLDIIARRRERISSQIVESECVCGPEFREGHDVGIEVHEAGCPARWA